jgi:hypothetical protein
MIAAACAYGLEKVENGIAFDADHARSDPHCA